jgi:hypothetical protein
VGSVPKSGCTFTDPMKLLMMVAEFGSTGAVEMSVFQALLLLNGNESAQTRAMSCRHDVTSQTRIRAVCAACASTAGRCIRATATGR